MGNFVKACIIKEATGFYLLMLQKYINSKCLGNISGNVSANNRKIRFVCINFLLILIIGFLILVVLSISIDI